MLDPGGEPPGSKLDGHVLVDRRVRGRSQDGSAAGIARVAVAARQLGLRAQRDQALAMAIDAVSTSNLPPPRASTMTSASRSSLHRRRARATLIGALAPCTWTG